MKGGFMNDIEIAEIEETRIEDGSVRHLGS